MIVIFPCRLAGRRTVRPVSSEYFSKIWSTGALKNLRKCSPRSAWPAPGGFAAVAGGLPAAPGAAAATCPATLASGVALGTALVAVGGGGNAGNGTALVFARRGRGAWPGTTLGLAFVGATGTLVAAAS